MPETTELMKRPRTWDDLVKKRTMELAWPAIVRYLGDDYRDADRAYTEKQIMSVLSESRDGYAMARELENRFMWAEDRELVEVMDEVSYDLSKAEKEFISQWVRTYNIKPERKIGDKVTTHVRKGEVGEIVKFYEDEAKYGVRYPDQPDTSSYVVEYEHVKDVENR